MAQDNLGRNTSADSNFVEQLAASIRKNDINITVTNDSPSKSSNKDNLPKEISEEMKKVFEKDYDKALEYLKTIKQFCDEKTKSKNVNKENNNRMSNAVNSLNQNLMKNMGTAKMADFGSSFVEGITLSNAHLHSIESNIGKLTNLFSTAGSGYVHDTHTEKILNEILAVLQNNGIGSPQISHMPLPGVPASAGPQTSHVPSSAAPVVAAAATAAAASSKGAAGSPMPTDIEHSSDEISKFEQNREKQFEILENHTKKFASFLLIDEDHAKKLIELMKSKNEITAKQISDINIYLNKTTLLSKIERERVSQAARLHALNFNAVGLADELDKAASNAINKLAGDISIKEAAIRDLKQQIISTNDALLKGLSGGVEIKKIFHGIFGEQIKFNTQVREALFITEGLGKASDSVRDSYLSIGRAAGAVSETGVDILTFQKAYLANLKSGIHGSENLNKITKIGLNLATMTGMGAETTAKTIGTWSLQLNMSNNQMSQFARGVRMAAQATGLMGDELGHALQNAKALADEMRNAGTLTADAASSFAQLSASARKFGVEKSVQPILKALSSSVEFYEKASAGVKALLFRAAARSGTMSQLQSGTIMNDPKAKKALMGGIEDDFKDILAQFGKTSISQLTDQEKTIANLRTKALGMGFEGIGEFEVGVKALKEGMMSFEERLRMANDELKKNLTQKQREAAEEKVRNLILGNSLSNLTKIDEQMKDAKSISEGLANAKISKEDAKKLADDTITALNTSLTKIGKTGDLIDPKTADKAFENPLQFQSMLEKMNEGQNILAIAQKTAADPALKAQQDINKIQQTIANNTGEMARIMTNFLGPKGMLVASIIAAVATSQAGSAFKNSMVNKLIAGVGSIGSGATKVTTTAAKEAVSWSTKLGGIFTMLTSSMSALWAAIAPFLWIVAAVAAAIVFVVALWQALQEAFKTVGFETGELTKTFGLVWEVIKKLWSGLVKLLSVVLIPLAFAIKILVKAFGWLFEKINDLLSLFGLGGAKTSEKSAAASSESEKSSAPESAASSASSAASSDKNSSVATVNTKPVTDVQNQLKKMNQNLPDPQKIMEDIMKQFAWLGEYAIVIGVWTILATAFTMTTSIIFVAATMMGLRIAAMLTAVAMMFKALTFGLGLLQKSLEDLSTAINDIDLMKNIKMLATTLRKVLLWVGALALAISVAGTIAAVAEKILMPILAIGLKGMVVLIAVPFGVTAMANAITLGLSLTKVAISKLYEEVKIAKPIEQAKTLTNALGLVLEWSKVMIKALSGIGVNVIFEIIKLGLSLIAGAIGMGLLMAVPLGIALMAYAIYKGLSLTDSNIKKLYEEVKIAKPIEQAKTLTNALGLVLAWSKVMIKTLRGIGVNVVYEIIKLGISLLIGAAGIAALVAVPFGIALIAYGIAKGLNMAKTNIEELKKVVENAKPEEQSKIFKEALEGIRKWGDSFYDDIFTFTGIAKRIRDLLKDGIKTVGIAIDLLTVDVALAIGKMIDALSTGIKSINLAVIDLKRTKDTMPEVAEVTALVKELMDWTDFLMKSLNPLIEKVQKEITPKLLKTSEDAADSLKKMMDGIASIFQRISLTNLKKAFAEFSIQAAASLPESKSLLKVFEKLDLWMKSITSEVLPKIDVLAGDLTKSIQAELNKGAKYSLAFGNMVKDLITIFDNIRLVGLSKAVRGFVSAWATGLPDAATIRNVFDGLFEWMRTIFNPDSPVMKITDAMKTEVKTFSENADKMKQQAKIIADAINSLAEAFKLLNPDKAVSAMNKLSRSTSKKLPDVEQMKTAIATVKKFIEDASGALGKDTGIELKIKPDVGGTPPVITPPKGDYEKWFDEQGGADPLSPASFKSKNTMFAPTNISDIGESNLGVGIKSVHSFLKKSAINADPSMNPASSATDMQPTNGKSSPDAIENQILQNQANTSSSAGSASTVKDLTSIEGSAKNINNKVEITNALLIQILSLMKGDSGKEPGSKKGPSLVKNPFTSDYNFDGLKLSVGFNDGATKTYV